MLPPPRFLWSGDSRRERSHSGSSTSDSTWQLLLAVRLVVGRLPSDKEESNLLHASGSYSRFFFGIQPTADAKGNDRVPSSQNALSLAFRGCG